MFVAVMAAAGVALAAHSRSATADKLLSGKPRWATTGIICAVAVTILVLEVSDIGGVASGFVKSYRGLGSLSKWPHAVIVAALIAYVAQRSARAPLQQRGDVSTTVIVGVVALAGISEIGAVTALSSIVGAITGSELRPPGPDDHLSLVLAWLAIASLVPIAVRYGMRNTVGQWVARVALVYLVPVSLGVTACQLRHDVPVSFWATPAQVVVTLTGIACAATLLALLGRPAFLTATVAGRLAIIPLLIIAGTSWLPVFITAPLTPAGIAIATALITLLWAMPPVAADKDRHSGVVLTASAQLLLVAAAAPIAASAAAMIGAIGPHSSLDDPTLALLNLGIPLSALLCARVTSIAK